MLGDHEDHARLVGRVDHVPATLQRGRHRLLDDRMFARSGGGHGQRRVRVVRGADVHRFDVRFAQHFVDIQVDGLDARPHRHTPRAASSTISHTATSCTLSR